MKKMVNLKEIAQIQFGLYAKPEEEGNVTYLQAKHFDDLGNSIGEPDTFIQLNQKNEAHLLNDGDIILVGKGSRNFAWTYHKSFGPAIPSSIFFVIKANKDKVIPEFLTTIFNMTRTQAHFQTLGAGSSIPSIRKSELEALPITLPSIEEQEKIVAIKQLHNLDMKISNQIIMKKQKAYQALINQLI